MQTRQPGLDCLFAEPIDGGGCLFDPAKSTGLLLLTLDADFRKSDIEVLSP